ncbi:hypothetical protein PLANTIT3_60708 [Plantibacter sp. T3]|nr:hypothetical protein PLANTIT3_60708 [Plantibacter sp. T3]
MRSRCAGPRRPVSCAPLVGWRHCNPEPSGIRKRRVFPGNETYVSGSYRREIETVTIRAHLWGIPGAGARWSTLACAPSAPHRCGVAQLHVTKGGSR